MLKLAKVFSDGALFLHSSVLELRGVAESGASVNARIMREGKVFSEATVKSDDNGAFIIPINTPSASFDEYTVSVRSGDDEYSFERVLFGELWLASGQSNMQMSNSQQPEWECEFCTLLSERKVRAYDPVKIPTESDFPIDPLDDFDGVWAVSDKPDGFCFVSALATAFSVELFDFFKKRGENIPLGFLNVSYGGTPISAWMPDSLFDKNADIAYKRADRAMWNKCETPKFQQPSCQYNHIIHPLLGVKTRGMIWYQGENDVCREQREHIYEKMLDALHRCYKDLFGVKGEKFPFIVSQIYPWSYEPNIPECNAGYLNRAFSELARKRPDEVSFVPVCDLPPIWTYHLKNGPIHPAHKYALGRRFAALTWNFCYEDEGNDVQKHPATLKSTELKGNVLRLSFSDVGSGLFVKEKQIRGLYIRSENGVYVSALCKIVSPDTLDVWHPYVENPVHVAYAVSSGEVMTNLFAGEFPVSPFCTEFSDEYGAVRIGIKPWLSNIYDSDFIHEEQAVHTYKRSFSLPIFYPCSDSAICFDSVYQRSGRSLNIWGDGEVFGAYVIARRYRPIDLYNYSELQMSVYNSAELHSFITVYYKEENGSTSTVKIDGAVKETLRFGWERVTFDLSGLHNGNITRLDFSFTSKEARAYVANIDELVLVPKN